MNIDPDELIDLSAKMEKPMERYIKWKQINDRFERGKKAKLSQLMMQHEGTVASREMEAYGSKEWAEYLAEWDNATKELAKAQVEYDTLQNRFAAVQSALSYLRESMKRIG